MNKILLLTLIGFLSFAVSDTAPPPVIEAARTAALVSTEHSMGECARIAHETCDQVFGGKCAKYNVAAIGNPPGYLVMFQCHKIKMTVGDVTVMVIAGSRTEGTSTEKLTEWMTQSYDLAGRTF